MFDAPDNSGSPQLTDRQQQVLAVVRDHLATHGYPPTVREIGDAIGVASSSTVHAHLAALERAGMIQRDPSKPRALKLAESVGPPGGVDAAVAVPGISENDVRVLPVLGRVAAGQPMLAEEHVDEHVATPAALLRSGESFVLRISGDSMVDAGIRDADLVVVRRQPVARSGQIVIGLVDDEATCKRLALRDGHVYLDPENPAYKPILADGVQILGVVTGLMRVM